MHTTTVEIDETTPGTLRPKTQGSGWLHVIPHLDPKYGGLSAAVPQLASAVAAYSFETVRIAGFCDRDEEDSNARHPGITINRWPASRMAWFRQPELKRAFRGEVNSARGVHLHGLWTQSSSASADAARLLKKPYVVSAHGMLDRWALANKRFKKSVYAALTERDNVKGAACLHALTNSEVGDYRRFGATQPIVVIPNGVTVPRSIQPSTFFDRHPALRGKRLVLFLSRIHPKKGLRILVEAWSKVSQRYPDAHLVLAGPDFENTRQSLEELIQMHGLSDTILFTGMLDQQLKWSALAAAECFILPSFSEGLSVATLEAMGCGLPVIITEQCNLPEVGTVGAGWTVQPTAPQVTSALDEMLGNSAAMNRSIGQRGRRLVEQKYSWPLIAEQLCDVYSWLEGGASPSLVEVIRD